MSRKIKRFRTNFPSSKLWKSGEQTAPKLVWQRLAQYLEDYNPLLISEDTSLTRCISNELDCDSLLYAVVVYCERLDGEYLSHGEANG